MKAIPLKDISHSDIRRWFWQLENPNGKGKELLTQDLLSKSIEVDIVLTKNSQ